MVGGSLPGPPPSHLGSPSPGPGASHLCSPRLGSTLPAGPQPSPPRGAAAQPGLALWPLDPESPAGWPTSGGVPTFCPGRQPPPPGGPAQQVQCGSVPAPKMLIPTPPGRRASWFTIAPGLQPSQHPPPVVPSPWHQESFPQGVAPWVSPCALLSPLAVHFQSPHRPLQL